MSDVPQLTTEEAIAFAERGEWRTWTAEQIARFQLDQEKLCMDFSAFHKAVEDVLGRPVFTHEFIDPQRLKDELDQKRPPATLADIMALLPANTPILVVRKEPDAHV